MPLIDKTIALAIADKGAYQYQQLEAAFIAMDGGATYESHIVSADDADVEYVGLSYKRIDQGYSNSLSECAKDSLGGVVANMEVHFHLRDEQGELLQLGGWDGYLSDQGELVSDSFNQIFKSVKGVPMLARGVFSESADTFADVISTGGALTFTDGADYGNGMELNYADGTNFAATELKVVFETNIVSWDVKIWLKDSNDMPVAVDLSLSGSLGDEITLPARYLDVFNVVNISGGNTSERFTIQNIKERQVSL